MVNETWPSFLLQRRSSGYPDPEKAWVSPESHGLIRRLGDCCRETDGCCGRHRVRNIDDDVYQ